MKLEPSLAAVLLRQWRESLGLSQNEAATRIGVDFVQVSKWERGAVRPGLRRALAIEVATDGAVPCRAWYMPSIAIEAAAS